MDVTGDSPYNPINGAESTPKIALLKAGRNQLASSGGTNPYVPMTDSYMPQQSHSYAKPALQEIGAGRPVRSTHALKDIGSPSNRAMRNYPQQVVMADNIKLSDMMKGRGSQAGMTNIVKTSQDNMMQMGGPSHLRSGHGHSQSMFIQPQQNYLRSSMPEDVQK